MKNSERKLREERAELREIQIGIASKMANGETLSAAESREYFDAHKRIKELDEAIGSGTPARDLDTRGVGGSAPSNSAFERYMRTGEISPELRLAVEPSEQRVTIAGNSDGAQPGQVSGTGGSGGGYLVAQDFWRNLQVALKQFGGISADFKQITTDTGAVMPWPTVNPTAVTANLLTELTQLNPAQDYVFGQGVLNAYTYATDPCLVSLQLMQDSDFNVSEFVAARFGEAIGRSLAAAAISGTGSSQPLGINTALAAGASAGTVGSGSISPVGGGWVQLATAASVKTFAAPSGATELAGNVLSPATIIAMIQAIDPAYYQTEQGRCKFYMSPAQAYNMRGVTDSNGRPILDFESGMEDGAVGRILGFDVVTDPGIAALTASTVGGPIFGNLAHAMVQRTVRNTGILRLQERYADYLAVAFLGWHRVDMRSNDLRAAVTVKPAAT